MGLHSRSFDTTRTGERKGGGWDKGGGGGVKSGLAELVDISSKKLFTRVTKKKG